MPTKLRHSKLPRFLLTLVISVLALVLASPAEAQVAIGGGRLQGTVKDREGNAIAGATITLTLPGVADPVSSQSNDEGIWVKGNLGFGRWTVECSAPGFMPDTVVALVNTSSRNPRVNFVLVAGENPADAAGASLFGGELGEKIMAGNVLFDAGDFAGALAAFDAIIAEEMAKEEPNPDVHMVHLSSGNAAFELNDYATAAQHYGALIEADPESREGRMGLAKTYMMERRLDEAVAELEQIDLTEIMDPIVFYNIGSLLFDQGQSAQAQTYYTLAVERDPDFSDAHMQLGLSMIQQGLMQECKPHFEKVIELDPESENAALAQQFLDMIQE